MPTEEEWMLYIEHKYTVWELEQEKGYVVEGNSSSLCQYEHACVYLVSKDTSHQERLYLYEPGFDMKVSTYLCLTRIWQLFHGDIWILQRRSLSCFIEIQRNFPGSDHDFNFDYNQIAKCTHLRRPVGLQYAGSTCNQNTSLLQSFRRLALEWLRSLI